MADIADPQRPAPLVHGAIWTAAATFGLVAVTTAVGVVGFAEGMGGFQDEAVDEDLMTGTGRFATAATYVLVALCLANLVLAAAQLWRAHRDRDRFPRPGRRYWILSLVAALAASPALLFAWSDLRTSG